LQVHVDIEQLGNVRNAHVVFDYSSPAGTSWAVEKSTIEFGNVVTERFSGELLYPYAQSPGAVFAYEVMAQLASIKNDGMARPVRTVDVFLPDKQAQTFNDKVKLDMVAPRVILQADKEIGEGEIVATMTGKIVHRTTQNFDRFSNQYVYLRFQKEYIAITPSIINGPHLGQYALFSREATMDVNCVASSFDNFIYARGSSRQPWPALVATRQIAKGEEVVCLWP
jgi:hypothetical protein